jgi:hypothetical protein
MSDKDLKDENIGMADQPNQEDKPLFSVDGRNYDKDAAVKKIESADGFINTLKTEGQEKDARIAQLQAQLDQATKLEEALASLKSQSSTEQTTTDKTTPVDTSAIMQQLSEQLKQQVSSTFSEKEMQQKALSNETESMNAAKAVFGSSYNAKLRERASALGMTDSDIVQEAKTNPAKFKELFGLNKKAQASITPTGSSKTVIPKASSKLDFAPKFNASGKRNASVSNMQAAAERLGIKDFNL